MYINVRLSDLNLENQIHQVFQMPALLITLNPYQGLKLLVPTLMSRSEATFNYLESLSGIETKWISTKYLDTESFNYLESLSGIETMAFNLNNS